MSHVTLARLIERDDFQKRLNEGRPIAVHELTYPICQAYDSVILESDVEVGGRNFISFLRIKVPSYFRSPTT